MGIKFGPFRTSLPSNALLFVEDTIAAVSSLGRAPGLSLSRIPWKKT